MFNRTDIMNAAWTIYRNKAALIGLVQFDAARFALSLRQAWADAKLWASINRQQAARTAERVANPVLAAARDELLSIETRDRWSPADRARVSTLNLQIHAA